MALKRLWLTPLLAFVLSCGVATTGPRQPSAASAGARALGDAKPGWLAVQLHSHSTYSDGVFTVPKMIAMAKNEGLDALGISDHESTTQWLDPAFLAERDLVMLHSEEARDDKKKNHMGLHGMTGIDPVVLLPRNDGIGEASRRDATIIANHPTNRFVAWTPLTWDSRVQAMEVWNGWFLNPMVNSVDVDPEALSNNEEAIAWWADLQAQGQRITPIAASDFHRKPQNLASPCTLVYANDRSEAAIMAGIRAGRTILVEHPRHQRVELTADAAGDGGFRAMVGDDVPLNAKFRVHATNAKGNVLRLMVGTREVLKTKVMTADWQRDFTLPTPAAGRFVYARLDSDFAVRRMHAMTGAIFLK